MSVQAKVICFSVFIILCYLQISKCYVCKRKVTSQRWVPETYYRTVRETYRGNCWYRCTKTRINHIYDERMVLRSVTEFKDECCQGYTEDYRATSMAGSLRCLPVCNPPCQNGYCAQPDECACESGYKLHETNIYKCAPVCSNGCEHGICIGPEACKCNIGYELKNNTCQPICDKPCVDGTCISPNKCECFSGYLSMENNVCLPYCSKGCSNGICTSPENCTCNDGWYKENEICKPFCQVDCGGGICISPNTCECNPNYIKVDNLTCVPHCSQGCANGICVSPENCVCNKGWVKDEVLNVCVPHCESKCGGGICARPDVCECYAGYILSDNGTCLPHCPQGCPYGECVNPGNCSCENGWYKNETEDECYPICDGNCVNSICVEPNKCECLSNYTKSENGSCVPYCSTGCPNGTCINPEICECNEGWQNSEYEICEPYCSKLCGYGNCVEPDVCECFPGYILHQNYDLKFSNYLCIPDCFGCNGTCVGPNNCICDSPLQAILVTEDGQKCDCIECSTNQSICHHTSCVLNDNFDLSTTDTIYDTTENKLFSIIQDEVSNQDETTRNILEEKYSTSYDADTLQGINRIYGIPFWVYIVASSIIILLLVLSITICYRRSITQYCSSSSYVVEDDKTLDGSVSTNTT